jgi:serine protease AprX
VGRGIWESYSLDPLSEAVDQAWETGIFVVVAAGNDGRDNSMSTQGYGTITAPGNDPYVITVGASNDQQLYNRLSDTLTTYSSKGPTAIDHIVKPDLVAPGNQVVSAQSASSALVTSYPANQIATDAYNPSGSSSYSPYFFTLSGTSMATPVVSGAAALLIDGNSALTPDQVKAKLMRTAWRGFPATQNITVTDPTTGIATTYTENADIFSIGAGQVDMWAAYNDTTTPTGSAASPVVTFNTTAKTVQLTLNSVGATNIIWGTGSPYATNIIWGTNVSGTNVIWGTNIIWGTNTVAGANIIWGTNSPWAQSTPGAEVLTIAINGDN